MNNIMRRHLFIVINDGGMHNYLPNVSKDRNGYNRFFRSPEGGYWDDSEITIHHNDFSMAIFAESIRFNKNAGRPYEYIVFVFCGHGFSDENGQRWLETRPDGNADSYVSVAQIKQACDGIRMLFIHDACASIDVVPLNEQRKMFSKFTGTNYESNCRELYNHLVSLTPSNLFVAGYASSIDESASENRYGGLYSQSLLREASVAIDLIKSESQYRHAPFSYIHAKAYADVVELSGDEQHPDCLIPRNRLQLPFVVVAK